MTITTATGWEAIGTPRALCGERVFTIDAPSIGPERHVPLLVLHGFPTSSFDYAAVLERLSGHEKCLTSLAEALRRAAEVIRLRRSFAAQIR